jgi:hypothetical protein
VSRTHQIPEPRTSAPRVRPGQTVENPVTGERFTFTATAASTEGELLAFDFALKPGGAVPMPHVHPEQSERFEVVAGETVGVPAYAVAFKSTLGAAAGQFDFPTWTMDVGKTPFEGANPGLATVAELSNYVIHESRHCEQWFRMARRTAGKGRRPLR